MSPRSALEQLQRQKAVTSHEAQRITELIDMIGTAASHHRYIAERVEAFCNRALSEHLGPVATTIIGATGSAAKTFVDDGGGPGGGGRPPGGAGDTGGAGRGDAGALGGGAGGAIGGAVIGGIVGGLPGAVAGAILGFVAGLTAGAVSQ